MHISEEKARNQYTLEVIAKNIKHFRILKNISQTELGLRSGITPGYITDIERCQHDVLISTITNIAYGLDVKPQELFVDDREEYLSKPRIDKAD